MSMLTKSFEARHRRWGRRDRPFIAGRVVWCDADRRLLDRTFGDLIAGCVPLFTVPMMSCSGSGASVGAGTGRTGRDGPLKSGTFRSEACRKPTRATNPATSKGRRRVR